MDKAEFLQSIIIVSDAIILWAKRHADKAGELAEKETDPVRTPVIPGFNDSKEAISAIRDFVYGFDNVRYELLKYHRLGESKYESLHRTYPMGEVTLEDSLFKELQQYQFNKISSQLEDIGWQKGAGI